MIRRLLAVARWRGRNAVAYARAHPVRLLARGAALAALVASATFFVVPLYWLFSAAFKPEDAFQYPPDPAPPTVTLDNFVALGTETAFYGTYLVNSLLISLVTAAATVALATLAGYALSQYSLPYERSVLTVLLVVQMIPVVAMVVPLYRLFALTSLLDTLAVVVITDTILVLPVATWLVKGYFDTIPSRLEEAVRVAGASRARTFLVLVPLARPAIATVAVYAFVVSWNQFIVPLTFTTSQSVWTFPVGLYEFISRRGVVDWGLLGAASLVAMIPVLLLFGAFQHEFVTGLAGSRRRGGGSRE